MSSSAQKEFRELAKIVRKNGFKVVPGGKSGRGKGGGHYHVLTGKGAKVLDENGPVILSGSPGDFRARDLAAARLIRAGVLKAEQLPWKPVKAKDRGGDDDGPLLGEPEPELTPNQRERVKRENDQRTRHERTQAIRGDLEPLISRLGGWTKRGMIGEMAAVVYHHSKDAPWGFPSENAAKANAGSLRKGGTLSDNAATCWESLIQTLQMAEVEGKLREGWFDLVRAARGLPPRSTPVVGYVPGSYVEHGTAVQERPTFGGSSGEIGAELERQYGDGGNGGPRWSERYPDDEGPLFEMQRNGGVRWKMDVSDDDLNELSALLGFFEGLAITRRVSVNGIDMEFFDGQDAGAQLDRLRAFVTKLSEAKFRELASRGQVAGAKGD